MTPQEWRNKSPTRRANLVLTIRFCFCNRKRRHTDGQFAKSRELGRRAADSAQRAGEKETAAEYQAHAAVRDALAGNLDFAKKEAEVALILTSGRQSEPLAAIAFGLTGDSAQAERFAADLGKRYPDDTIQKFNYVPMIRAAGALHDGDGKRAIEAFSASSPYELGETNTSFTFALYPVYLRGEAYLAAKQGAAALVSFKRFWTIRVWWGTGRSGRLHI